MNLIKNMKNIKNITLVDIEEENKKLSISLSNFLILELCRLFQNFSIIFYNFNCPTLTIKVNNIFASYDGIKFLQTKKITNFGKLSEEDHILGMIEFFHKINYPWDFMAKYLEKLSISENKFVELIRICHKMNNPPHLVRLIYYDINKRNLNNLSIGDKNLLRSIPKYNRIAIITEINNKEIKIYDSETGLIEQQFNMYNNNNKSISRILFFDNGEKLFFVTGEGNCGILNTIDGKIVYISQLNIIKLETFLDISF